jgi:anhydro-N-acetylmuramic acid kinase
MKRAGGIDMRVLGLMSGTSADGVDVALVTITESTSGRKPSHGPAPLTTARHAERRIPATTALHSTLRRDDTGATQKTQLRGAQEAIAKTVHANNAENAQPQIAVHVERFITIPYPAGVRENILRIAEGAVTTAGEISELNFQLGDIFGKCALTALRRFRVAPTEIDLIGSHGQTIFHHGAASTLQIGEPSMIAARTRISVVADFRPSDIAAGGQGAPLVPFADYLLLRSEEVGRIALNLGGIANVTIIPAGATPHGVIAFDTGPANIVIDALVRHFTRGRQSFDGNAAFARRGQILPGLLEIMLAHPYFAKRSPKTAGREQFGHSFVEEALAWAAAQRARSQDVVFTATLLTAVSVAQALDRMHLKRGAGWEIIVSGGGAHNPLLMDQLAALLPGFRIVPSGAIGIPEDAKEAMAFAILAYEAWHGRPNNLPSATGARRSAILGKIVYAHP